MKMNKRGDVLLSIVSLTPVGAAFVGAAALLIAVSQLTPVKDSFRERKAVEKLVASGLTKEEAKSTIAGWTKEQVLDSIRDNVVMATKTGNGGIFVGGYQQ